MEVTILRLSHRAERDKRVTTHLGLVARAFGASKMLITGMKDEHLADSIQRVVDSWGGPFEVDFVPGWRSVIDEHKKKGFITAHLTMYGLPVQDEVPKIRKAATKSKKVLVIVGGEKVPIDVYHEVDYNVSVTSQPHSEISALAVFLDRLLDGKELEKKFTNASMSVAPQKCGKKILSK